MTVTFFSFFVVKYFNVKLSNAKIYSLKFLETFLMNNISLNLWINNLN